MRKNLIPQRERIYCAVEGEGEQAFIKFLQILSDDNNLHAHLDCELLGGGGYKSMLEKAIRYRRRKERHKAKESILLVDSDRAEKNDDGWSIEKLRKEAKNKNFSICLQIPNQEGLLLRMMPNNENLKPSPANARQQLRKAWPEYQKPVDAFTLKSKFTLKDLIRTASADKELKQLLDIVGFASIT